MSEYLIQGETLTAIANAIREKLGTSDEILTEMMESAIRSIETGVDTSDATATAAQILAEITAYVNGNKVTGTMTNNGAVTKTLNTSTTSYTIPEGYHDGTGKVSITTETKTATPTTSSQSITPTSGKVLSKVTVNGDANLIAENIKSGISIFGVDGSLSSGAQFATGTFTTPDPSDWEGLYQTGDVIVKINNLTFTPKQVFLYINKDKTMYATNTENGYLVHPVTIMAGVVNVCIEGGKLAEYGYGLSYIAINFKAYNYGLSIIQNGFSWVFDKSPMGEYPPDVDLASSYSYIAIG